jgi:hypothetical protein
MSHGFDPVPKIIVPVVGKMLLG